MWIRVGVAEPVVYLLGAHCGMCVSRSGREMLINQCRIPALIAEVMQRGVLDFCRNVERVVRMACWCGA